MKHPSGPTPTGVCKRCGLEKQRAAFGTRSDGRRRTICLECDQCAIDEREARRRRNKTRVVDGVTEKFCWTCLRWLPMDAEHFYPNRRSGLRRGPFIGPCIACKLAAAEAYREAHRGDPDFERRREESRKRWAQKNAERWAEMKNDWRRRAMMNPAYRRRRNEAQRLAYRLRRERDGHALRSVEKTPRIATMPMLPAMPIAAFIDERITARTRGLNGHADGLNVVGMVCADLDIAERQLRAWRSGEIKMIELDTVDRILLNAEMHWWDVFDPGRWPEAAEMAEREFEGVALT